MMRLIDADELILHLNDFMLQQSPIDVDMVLVTKELSRCLRDSTRRDLRTVIK